MKTFTLLLSLFAFRIAVDPTPCTTAIKDLVDDLFELTIDIEEKGFNIDATPIKDILEGITEILGKCAGNDLDLTKYDNCVDSIMPVMPLIQKLITDIKSGQTSNIMLDVTQIGLQLANGITSCVQKPTMMIGEYKL